MRPVPSSRSVLATPLGRRTTLTLGAALVTLAVSGCDLDDLTGADAGTTDGGSDGERAPADDPDRGLLDAALADLDARLALVVAVRAATPRLRRALRPLEEMHLAHRAVLQPTPATPTAAPTAAPRVPTVPARALAAVRDGETAHQQALATASADASSGALARLLASISASVAQHLALLPVEVPGATG